MDITVEFPSVVYRDGPEGVRKLARGLEQIGYDRIDLFDHVVMGHELEGRPSSRYPATMPLLEALETLAFLAACTETIGLGTEVLVLPQRHPVLVAKQASTIDTLSGGRLRLGVGVGWQEAEYEALGESFADRGRRMDEAIDLLRLCWSEDPIAFVGEFYRVEAMAMEPKPPQGGELPIWVGGHSEAALRRAGQRGDGWLAVGYDDLYQTAAEKIDRVREHATAAGRDARRLGFQAQLSPPPRPGNESDRSFYSEPERVAEAAGRLREIGFGGVAVNLTGIFLAGARSVDALLEGAEEVHAAVRGAVD